jgi:hypothetical protein
VNPVDVTEVAAFSVGAAGINCKLNGVDAADVNTEAPYVYTAVAIIVLKEPTVRLENVTLGLLVATAVPPFSV